MPISSVDKLVKDHGRSRGQKKTMVKDHLANDQMVIYQKRPVRPVFLKKSGGRLLINYKRLFFNMTIRSMTKWSY